MVYLTKKEIQFFYSVDRHLTAVFVFILRPKLHQQAMYLSCESNSISKQITRKNFYTDFIPAFFPILFCLPALPKGVVDE